MNLRLNGGAGRSIFLGLLALLAVLAGSGGGIMFLLPDGPDGAVSGQGGLAVTGAVVFRQVSVVSPGGGSWIPSPGTSFQASVEGVQSDKFAIDIAMENRSSVPLVVTLALNAPMPVVAKVPSVPDDVANVIAVGPNLFVIQVNSTGTPANTQADITLTGRLTSGMSITGTVLPGVRTRTTFVTLGPTEVAALVDNFEVTVGGSKVNLNSGFENGLEGFQTTGDVQAIPSLGSITPPTDSSMAFMTTDSTRGADPTVLGVTGRDISRLIQPGLSPKDLKKGEVKVGFDINLLTNQSDPSMSEGNFFRAVLVGFLDTQENTLRGPIPIVTLMEIHTKNRDFILPSNTKIRLDSPLDVVKSGDFFQVEPPTLPQRTTRDLTFFTAPLETGFTLQTGFHPASVVISGLVDLKANVLPVRGADAIVPFTHFEIWLMVAKSGAGAPTPASQPTLAPQTSEAKMQGVAFVPSSITIKVGDTVRWTNLDSVPHTVTSGRNGDQQAGSLFDSPFLAHNQTFSHIFNQKGTFLFFCRVHPIRMDNGTVNVQ